MAFKIDEFALLHPASGKGSMYRYVTDDPVETMMKLDENGRGYFDRVKTHCGARAGDTVFVQSMESETVIHHAQLCIMVLGPPVVMASVGDWQTTRCEEPEKELTAEDRVAQLVTGFHLDPPDEGKAPDKRKYRHGFEYTPEEWQIAVTQFHTEVVQQKG